MSLRAIADTYRETFDNPGDTLRLFIPAVIFSFENHLRVTANRFLMAAEAKVKLSYFFNAYLVLVTLKVAILRFI